MLQKGPVHDLCTLYLVEKIFDGEIIKYGFEQDEWPSDLSIDYGKVPEEVFVSPVRPVLQEYRCRGRPRRKPYYNPNQGVLDL